MAMLLMLFSQSRVFWPTKFVMGSLSTRSFMSRNHFSSIRSSLNLCCSYHYETTTKDPLWHPLFLLKTFMRNAACMAVCMGVLSFDGNTFRTKARSKTRSYIATKLFSLEKNFPFSLMAVCIVFHFLGQQ